MTKKYEGFVFRGSENLIIAMYVWGLGKRQSQTQFIELNSPCKKRKAGSDMLAGLPAPAS